MYFSIVVSVCSKSSCVEGEHFRIGVQQQLLHFWAKVHTFYIGEFATHWHHNAEVPSSRTHLCPVDVASTILLDFSAVQMQHLHWHQLWHLWTMQMQHLIAYVVVASIMCASQLSRSYNCTGEKSSSATDVASAEHRWSIWWWIWPPCLFIVAASMFL